MTPTEKLADLIDKAWHIRITVRVPNQRAYDEHELDCGEQAILLAALRGSTDRASSLLPTCCVTGRIAGDGFACGDCDPCSAAHTVPDVVRRLIAERDEWADKYAVAMDGAALLSPQDGTVPAAGDAERERCAQVADGEADEYQRHINDHNKRVRDWSDDDRQKSVYLHAKESASRNLAGLIRAGYTAPASSEPTTTLPDRQADVLRWAIATFGAVAADKTERVMRFIEEAIELAHALDLPPETISRIIGRVYSRPPGTPNKEIGQSAMTLEALAEVISVSVEQECASEWERVQSIPAEHWAQRHAAKVKIGITADAAPPTSG